jgi:ribosomal protein S24E
MFTSSLPILFINGYEYQLKFVAEQTSDFNEIRALLDRLKNVDSERVLIKTVKELRAKSRWIVEKCKKYGYGLRRGFTLSCSATAAARS